MALAFGGPDELSYLFASTPTPAPYFFLFCVNFAISFDIIFLTEYVSETFHMVLQGVFRGQCKDYRKARWGVHHHGFARFEQSSAGEHPDSPARARREQ